MKEKLAKLFEGKGLTVKQRILVWGAITLVGVMIIFATYYLPESFSVEEGDISPATIEARQTVTYEDKAKTEANRKAAEDRVGDIYVFDTSRLDSQVSQIEQIFKVWDDMLLLPEEDRLSAAQVYISQLQLKEGTASAILSMDSITLQALKSEAVNIMSEQWLKGVREDEVETARKNILDEVYLRVNDEEQVAFTQAIFRFINLEPNYIFDEDSTSRAKQEAANKEQPVLATIYRNQKVIGKGEIVTAEHIEMLKALGYQESMEPYIMVAGTGLFTLGMFAALYMYLKQYRRNKFETTNELPLFALLFLVILVLARLVVAINISPEAGAAEQVACLIPASAGAILTAILLDKAMGLFYAVGISFYIGILSGGMLPYAVVSFCGCLMGIYSVSRFSQRTDWVKAGLMISCVNAWTIFAFGMINNSSWTAIFYGLGLGMINGFISPILAYGSLPLLESTFKVTTSISLMELANPRQPLLKELLLKAPGTYHHSILVGNLAEAAADAVGADPVLVRVGAYYHDIGKTKRPYFFTENQLGEANPHDKLTPALSALILSSHVKDGVELARKNKLPEKVIDFIAQHHGTGLMAFFYHKAVEEAGSPDKVKESDFRYPGPLPQSKETAIVMLADSVEAAIRSMKVTGEKMEAAVRKIINDKLTDGQLEDSHLSLSDLKVIGQSFIQVLNGIYHSRVEYPENVLAAMKKGKPKNEAIDTKPAEEAPAEGTETGNVPGGPAEPSGDGTAR